ncbi:2OG-Fe(II) oxygenase [Parahaliea aestuarii]|uniref:2OG-Fe(II) oxygenase n=2 Tax=Parahaliea aestuarii TaxID=1852021 RepID=A0A5C8ZQ55_9GAMM|nr:2OG-Fe(II) oxygenase [Parahaliea aestuarii]
MVAESHAQPARVVAGDNDLRKTAWRETELVEQGAYADEVLNLVRRIYRDYAEPFYHCRLRSLESPHILRYSSGSYYRPHADSDQLNPDTGRWEKTLDRDLSLLLYLDEDYEGGELVFPNLDFEIRPCAGMLLMFPSDFRYLHGVRPVSRGQRHAVVSWCALQGPRKQRVAS